MSVHVPEHRRREAFDGVIGGRWAVVRLDRKQGAPVEVLTPFAWNAEAQTTLASMRSESSTPDLLGLATCLQCSSSDEGCNRCNPEREPVPGR